jgi:IS6 family transposase
MILNALVERLKRRSKDDFKGRHFEAALILQAVSWYLRYPLSYRDSEELFRERGLEIDHSTLNRWVLTYAPLIEKRLRQFRKPQCGSIRIDETYIKIRGQWRYLYWAIDKHGTPVDFLLTAKRDLDAAKRFFRKMLQDQPLLAPDRIGTDGANTYPPTIVAARTGGLLARDPLHSVTKPLQQGIESDHFRVKKNMPKIGGFQAFHTARRTIQGFEAMLWLRKGFGCAGAWMVREQNRLLAVCFGLRGLTKRETGVGPAHPAAYARVCDRPPSPRWHRRRPAGRAAPGAGSATPRSPPAPHR